MTIEPKFSQHPSIPILQSVCFHEFEVKYISGIRSYTMVLLLDSSEFVFLMEPLLFLLHLSEKLSSQNKNNQHEICLLFSTMRRVSIFQMKMHFFAPSENCSRRQDIFLMNGNTGMTILDRVISGTFAYFYIARNVRKLKKYSQILVRKSKYLK